MSGDDVRGLGDGPRRRDGRGSVTFSLLVSLLVLIVGLALGWLASEPLRGAMRPGPAIDASILAGRNVTERTARFARTLELARPDALAALREIVDGFAPGPQEAELVLFAEWWARFDPRAALEWARAVESRTSLPIPMRVYRTWARSDPHAALAVAQANMLIADPKQVQGGGWQNPGIQAVLTGWASSSQPGLEQWIFETPDRVERQGLMAHLARQRVALRDPVEVWQWALELPDPLAHDMFPRVASALAARDPALAARLAAPLIARREFEALPRRIATRWAKRDPQRAFEWLSTLPEGGVRRDAVLESARTWLGVDPAGFMDFMSERVRAFPEWLEPGFELHARALANQGARAEALAIVQRVRHENRRDYNQTLILRSWIAEDPEAASAWMDAHAVSPEIRRRAGQLAR